MPQKKFITLCVLCACSSLSAQADEAYAGRWYVLPNLGVMHSDHDIQSDDNNFAYGLSLGKQLDEHWDLQLGLKYAQSDTDSSAYTGGKYKQTMLGLDALYFFSRSKFRPFVLAGVGVAHNSLHYNGLAPTLDSNGSENSWMANVGLGAQYSVSERIALQLDLRQVYSRMQADGGLFGNNNHHTIGNTYLNFGVLFNFGAEPAAPVASKPEPMPVAQAEPVVAPVASKREPEPAPVPAEVPAKKVVAPFGKVVIEAKMLFDFDESHVRPRGITRLNEEIVSKMQENPQVQLFLITGYTDKIGSAQYNQKLSERRAQAVKDYLVEQGIAPERLHAVGRGEEQPIVECPNLRRKALIECLQPNRRVELEIEETGSRSQ